MKKIILIITLSLFSVFYSQFVLATEPAVIILRHAEEGACDFTEVTENWGIKTRGRCLTKLGNRHAELYQQKLDSFLRTKNISPINQVIVIDPYALVQPGGMSYPTTNPYYTIHNYLDAHEFIQPQVVATAPGMNELVAEKLKDYFDKKLTGSTLIVWESNKMDTNTEQGKPLLTLIIKANDISKLPTDNGEISTSRDNLYLLTNGQADGKYVKYNLQTFFQYFNKNNSNTYIRDPSGNLSKKFDENQPSEVTNMIICPFQGQSCDKDCKCTK